MRKPVREALDLLRRTHPMMGPSLPGTEYGYFVAGHLHIISSGVPESAMSDWEHVSVSCANRCPTWDEMCLVKDLFWDDEETVLQFHPCKSQYVNTHPYTLHLWKQVGVDMVLPPKELIG